MHFKAVELSQQFYEGHKYSSVFIYRYFKRKGINMVGTVVDLYLYTYCTKNTNIVTVDMS